MAPPLDFVAELAPMARRGPRPKPTSQKKLAGNPGKRRLNDREPVPPAKPIARPSWITGTAAAEWNRVAPLLETMGLLTCADEVTLAAYCQAAAELIIATRELDKMGRLIVVKIYSRKGEEVGERVVLNPAVKLQRDAFARLKQFLGEFGLSPAARTNLKVDAPNESTPDELQAIMLKLHTPAAKTPQRTAG
jgi:P27 family predicted phage terminase small subunit